MSFFNEKQIEAMFGGDYICRECGAKMEFEDEWEDTLICPKCGFETDSDHYGFDSEEEYEALYPTKEEVDRYYEEDDDDEEEDDCGEVYDDVCGELDDYVPPYL